MSTHGWQPSSGVLIDRQLVDAGWLVQDRAELNLFGRLGVAVRDKANLDITWLRDESLEDLGNLPAPEVIAREIVEDLTAALAEFEAVASALEMSARCSAGLCGPDRYPVDPAAGAQGTYRQTSASSPSSLCVITLLATSRPRRSRSFARRLGRAFAHP